MTVAAFGPLLVPCPACGATITLPVEATTRADDSALAVTLAVAPDSCTSCRAPSTSGETAQSTHPAGRHRLQLHYPNGDPSRATVHLDGELLTWVSRVELVLDANTQEAEVRLTAPAALIDLDADVMVDVAESSQPYHTDPHPSGEPHVCLH